LSLWNLVTTLGMVEAWGVAHLTFEDKSILYILLVNFGQLSTWELPGFGVWLHKQGVLLPKLWFSILIILVQTPLLGHTPTAIPPTQCAFMMVSISVLTPPIALKSNG
jgi:hypothetical protein